MRIIIAKYKKSAENDGNEELGQIDLTQSQKPICLAQRKREKTIKENLKLAALMCWTRALL